MFVWLIQTHVTANNVKKIKSEFDSDLRNCLFLDNLKVLSNNILSFIIR